MKIMEIKNKKWFPILILTVFCLLMFFAFLGSYPLIDVDETRYVRIAQEMIIANNFLTPTINGEIFLEKPPLFFWLEDISFILFGFSECAARLPLALVASFGVFMTYFFGLLGVNGPMPLEFTDYVFQRSHNYYDQTWRRFLDIINHRFLTLFYRAWAENEQAVSFDRADD